jgi:hypothetical protein
VDRKELCFPAAFGFEASRLRGFAASRLVYPLPPPPFSQNTSFTGVSSLLRGFSQFCTQYVVSENSKYRDLVYYFLVITLFCAVLRIPDDLSALTGSCFLNPLNEIRHSGAIGTQNQQVTSAK